ncbi:hypothetical protein EOL96_06635 [Candidatus Saccharibacteria bacterium]|nr:hypothetical protein [Candidatus Saccharibacteria bacterium]
MLWLFAIAVEIILGTIIALRYRVLARNNPDEGLLATAIMYGLGVAPIGIVYALFFSGQTLVFTASTVAWTIFASILFAIGNVMIYRAYSKMDASLYAIINSSKYVIIVIVAAVLLGDTLEPGQLLGASMILASSVYISAISRKKQAKNTAIRYIVLAFVASAVVAFAQLSERVAVVAAPMSAYILLSWSLQALLLLVFVAPQLRQKGFHLSKQLTRNLIVMGILRGISGVCVVYAVAHTQNVSLVFSLIATMVVTISIASYIFLGERSFAKSRFMAAISATLGVILVIT